MRLTRLAPISAFLLLPAVPLALSGGGEVTTPTVVDFESGAEGWQGPMGGGGGSGITPEGGNGGGAGLRTVFNDFGVTFHNDGNLAFLGDYTQFDEVTISVDIKVNLINFFENPVSRPWLLELRDFDTIQGNYPWTSVWFLFDDISASNNGSWTTYSVTILDPTSTVLPEGWQGYGDEDPNTFEPILPPGVTFADVLSGVDEIAFTTLQPGFFFGFTDFDLTLDNIGITTTVRNLAQLSTRQGLPNPQSYTSGLPVLGTSVQATVDLSTTGHTTAFLIGFASPLDVVLGNGARLLVNVADPGGELLGLGSRPGPLAVFDVPIPCDPALAGRQIYTQALHAFGTVPFALSNAVDWTLGD